jgi:TonB family protein
MSQTPIHLPSFPFGDAETNNERVSEYIRFKLRWPDTGADCSGSVLIRVVIEKTGELTNAEILRPLCPGFDEEAMRVVNEMPPWKPGLKNGEPVRTVTMIPVRFMLQY